MAEMWDLVLATLPGVQAFIAESRTTADLHAGSRLVSQLTDAMRAVARDRGRVVLPAEEAGGAEDAGNAGAPPSPAPSKTDSVGLPNRVVALVPPGTGRQVATDMADAVRTSWKAMVDRLPAAVRARDAETPGFPSVRWVVVPEATEATYARAWAQAGIAMDARRRTRDFPGYRAAGRPVCTLSARWASSGRDRRTGEELSTVAHVKRAFRSGRGFPSTLSLASADYREKIIAAAETRPALREAVAGLRKAYEDLTSDHPALRGSSDLPGLGAAENAGPDMAWLAAVEGAWVYPGTWEPTSLARDHGLPAAPDSEACRRGERSADDLRRAAQNAGIPPPTSYLAVIAQDADRMGEAMSNPPPGAPDLLRWHGQVSRMLVAAARREVRAVETEAGLLGRAVYAGGDDLLCFTPASSALTAARTLNEVFTALAQPLLPEVTASTAVVYFHAGTALQTVVRTAHGLLDDAKQNGRPGFGAAVLRRGGERARVILPWEPPAPDAGTDARQPSVALLADLAEAYASGLSPRLASSLERDRVALASLPPRWRDREIRRLMGRHGGADEIAGTLAVLGANDEGRVHEHAPAGRALAAVGGGATDLALVAHFIAAEARPDRSDAGRES